MSLVLARYQAFQRSGGLLREIEKLRETLTGFSGKQPNFNLTVMQIQIVFSLAYLIDADESKSIQSHIQDKRQVGVNPTQATSKHQWDKTRAYFGGISKMWGETQYVNSFIDNPISMQFVIINVPNLSPSTLRQFLSLRIYVQWPISQQCCTRFAFSRLLLQLIDVCFLIHTSL